MVIFDQLRISDDGQLLYIDAHVNKAQCFEGVYMQKITICTEDQVLETNPYQYGDEFIYQDVITPHIVLEEILKPVTKRVQILSEQNLLDALNEYGGIPVECTGLEDSQGDYLNFVLSGKFKALDGGLTPKLVMATANYDPTSCSLGSDEVLSIVDGVESEEKGHHTWKFQMKNAYPNGYVADNSMVYLYLYRQDEEGEFSLVDIRDEKSLNDPRYALTPDEVYDYTFLHFLWQMWSEVPIERKKELHLVLRASDMNEYFSDSNLSNHMFFVYIECDGNPTANTPCTLDEQTTLAVTFDYGVLFYKALGYTKELAQNCSIPGGFTDFILNYDALKLAIETEHYVSAIDFWKKLKSDDGIVTTRSANRPCGCHG